MVGQGKINHHRGAARQTRARAAFEIIRAVGAHERHFQVRMRVNAAGHDVTAGRVQFLVAFQPLADLDDLAAIDKDIGLVGQVSGDDGAVLDDCGHWFSPYSV